MSKQQFSVENVTDRARPFRTDGLTGVESVDVRAHILVVLAHLEK